MIEALDNIPPKISVLIMATRSASSQTVGFLIYLLAVFVAAVLGAIASREAAAFYTHLLKPVWAPPVSVFGPVWSVLYLMMAFAVWLVWCRPQRDARALVLFGVQLTANALWSWLFFAWHRGALAFLDVLLLWVLIVATILAFWRSSRLAALLMMPYWLWVSFATVLTFAVWQANHALL